MTQNRHPAGLDKTVQRHRRRRDQGNPSPSLLRHLALIGSLGWLIVVPFLAGIFAGQWIDQRFGTGITFTAGLMLMGLAGGCVLAWRRIHNP